MMEKKSRGTKSGILLVYPDTKSAALGSPGFKQVYKNLSAEENCRVDLGWYDNNNEQVVYERKERKEQYDCIAFSVPFELLYMNVVKILRMLHVETEKKKRNPGNPVVLIGGAAPTINPGVAGVLADVVCVGEVEAHIINKSNTFTTCHRSGAAMRLTPMIGISIPIKNRAVPDNIFPAQDIDSSLLLSFDNPAQSAFRNAGLVEVGRGCSRGCRFCAAGHIYLPVRHRSVEDVLRDAKTYLGKADRIGLVGASVSDHPSLKEILQGILDMGFGITTSSFRADMLDEELATLLSTGGIKTVTIAPEGGSERIRRIINKRLTEKQILKAVESCNRAGIKGLKLYYMVGLPWEKQSDIESIIGLTETIKSIYKGPGKKITVSVNPFIPKPQTPFQWCGMAEPRYIKKVYTQLKKGMLKMRGVTLKTMSVRTALKEAVISLGNENVGMAVIENARDNVPWKKALSNHGVDVDKLVHRMKTYDEIFPWDEITGEKRKAALFASFEKAEKTARKLIF